MIFFNDHLKYGYSGQAFYTTFGKANSCGSFKEEVLKTCQLISNSTDKKIGLFLSGGTDSTIVALSLLELNIPFTPIIYRYANEKNYFDVSLALIFCEKKNLTPVIIDIDIDEYTSNLDFSKYNVPYRCMQCEYIKKGNELNLFPIVCSGEIVFGEPLTIHFNEQTFLSSDYIKENNLDGVPYFYWYRPELSYSFLMDEAAQKHLTHLKKSKKYYNNAYIMKLDVHRKYWPELPHTPKVSGWEFLNLENKEKLIESVQLPVKSCKYNVDEFINMIKPDIP